MEGANKGLGLLFSVSGDFLPPVLEVVCLEHRQDPATYIVGKIPGNREKESARERKAPDEEYGREKERKKKIKSWASLCFFWVEEQHVSFGGGKGFSGWPPGKCDSPPVRLQQRDAASENLRPSWSSGREKGKRYHRVPIR